MATTATPPKPSASAPPAGETKEQRLKRLISKARTYRDSSLRNRGAVDGRPDKVYCWVNKREERQLFYESMGWELVKNDPLVKSQHKKEDGTHQRADLILYQIDRDLFEGMEADRQLAAIESMQSAETSFESAAERAGAPTYKPRL